MESAKESQTDPGGETLQIIEAETARLLDSPMFLRSPVLSRLMQYLVAHRRLGARSAPKAYAIATEALGRSADFDPAIDSYPRVMIGRLRNLLDRYYAETPWVDRLRIPQGSYEIVVQHRNPPPGRPPAASDTEGEADGAALDLPPDEAAAAVPPPSRRRRNLRRLGIVALVALALVAGWWLAQSQIRLFGNNIAPMPTLEVTQPAAGDSGESRALARALDSKLRDGLRRFGLVELMSSRTPGLDSSERPADYRLDSSMVRTLEGPVNVTLVLNRVADERAIWSEQFQLSEDQTPQFTAIESAVAQIGGDYGVIVRDQVRRQPDNFGVGYPCLAQYNRLRQMRQTRTARRVDRCLRASIAEDPDDPQFHAALSLLRYGDWQSQPASAEGKAAFAEARRLARTAYDLGPNSSAGLFAIARAHMYSGNCPDGMMMGDAAVALNPFDADIAGFLGLFKVACGLPAEGEALLRRSLALDPTYAGVPAVTLAFLLSQRGEQDGARAILDGLPSPSNMEPQYLMVRAIVLARQGQRGEARRLWARLLEYTGQATDAPPEAVLRQFMITPTVIKRSAAALRDSGVVPARPAG